MLCNDGAPLQSNSSDLNLSLIPTGGHHAAVPAALDVSWAARIDLWTYLSQHVTVPLTLKLCWADDSFTSNL